ncbi:MAG: hypothetical protein MK297_00725 [Planctomycetes bacterium]|nr:hypothetical protein [Planctomycetota bacterium]
MEKKVFPEPAVAGILNSKFIEARIHTDHEALGESNRALQLEMTGSVAQPIYLLLDPKSGEVHGRLDGATLGDNQPFIDFLESGWSAARG